MAGVHLLTADGVRLAARLLPGPGDVCVVLAHGFGMSTSRAAVRRVAAALSAHATVLAFDARGHGMSAGRSTLGDLEVLDVDAAVAAARRLGHERVVTCGFSMGGAAAVRHAGLTEVAGHAVTAAPDAVAAVSTTSQWSDRATAEAALRRLHAVVETRPGRLFARSVLRTRVSPAGWATPPESPLDVAPRVRVPLIVVHGDRDGYFPVAHARALAGAAGGPVELWVEPGLGHAETATPPELLDRLGRRLAALAGTPVP